MRATTSLILGCSKLEPFCETKFDQFGGGNLGEFWWKFGASLVEIWRILAELHSGKRIWASLVDFGMSVSVISTKLAKCAHFSVLQKGSNFEHLVIPFVATCSHPEHPNMPRTLNLSKACVGVRFHRGAFKLSEPCQTCQKRHRILQNCQKHMCLSIIRPLA